MKKEEKGLASGIIAFFGIIGIFMSGIIGNIYNYEPLTKLTYFFAFLAVISYGYLLYINEKLRKERTNEKIRNLLKNKK